MYQAKVRGGIKTLTLVFVFTVLTIVPGAFAGPWKFSKSTEFSFRSTYYPDALNPEVNRSAQAFHFTGSASLKWKRDFKLKLLPVAQWDPVNLSKRERAWVDLQEGYLQFQKELYVIQLGFNQFTWGVTDVYNPLDGVNPRRYFDPLQSPKMGVASAFLKLDPVPLVSVELIYIPTNRKSQLPGENSRWLPRDYLRNRQVATTDGNVTIQLPERMKYRYEKDEVLNQALSNNYGARALFLLPSLDIQVAYFNGAAGSPATGLSLTGSLAKLLPEIVIEADPDVGIIPIYYRHQFYGGSAVYATGEWIFRYENTFNRPISKRSDLPVASQSHVFEIEKSFLIFKQNFTFLLLGTYSKTSDQASNDSTSLFRLFDKAGILAIRYAPSSKWSSVASLLYDTVKFGKLAHGEVSYLLRDGLRISAMGDVLAGKPETPVGTYRRNDRVSLGLQYSF